MKCKALAGFTVCTAVLVASACVSAPARAADESDRLVPVTAQKVAPHIWYLHARGGNITALIGDDGTLIVDAEFASVVPAIIKKLEALGGGAPKFVINTHYHQDHTGGNAAMRAAGATIIAQHNLRMRLEQLQRVPRGASSPAPIPAAQLPMITYERKLDIHFDGQTVRVVHLPPAHTAGDSVVIFDDVRVLATGDLFFNGMYPIIDVTAGGSIGGAIADVNRLLRWADADTVIIPGHGPVADRAALAAYRDMLVAVRDRVLKMVDAGKTLAEIQAARPTADFDAKWGGRISPEHFVAEIYYSLRPHFPGS